MEEISTNETYKHVEDSTIKEVQDGHAAWMMQENLAEPQDEKDPNERKALTAPPPHL